MIIWILFGGLAFACMAFGYMLRWLIEQWQRESRELDAEIDSYQSKGRHAASQPRREPERTSLVKSPDRIVWERDEAVGGRMEFTPSMATRRAAVDVILPEPGTWQPQAGRDSGPGTDTMPRIGSTTGELIKLTGSAEQFRQQLSADNAAWLEEWSTPA